MDETVLFDGLLRASANGETSSEDRPEDLLARGNLFLQQIERNTRGGGFARSPFSSLHGGARAVIGEPSAPSLRRRPASASPQNLDGEARRYGHAVALARRNRSVTQDARVQPGGATVRDIRTASPKAASAPAKGRLRDAQGRFLPKNRPSSEKQGSGSAKALAARKAQEEYRRQGKGILDVLSKGFGKIGKSFSLKQAEGLKNAVGLAAGGPLFQAAKEIAGLAKPVTGLFARKKREDGLAKSGGNRDEKGRFKKPDALAVEQKNIAESQLGEARASERRAGERHRKITRLLERIARKGALGRAASLAGGLVGGLLKGGSAIAKGALLVGAALAKGSATLVMGAAKAAGTLALSGAKGLGRLFGFGRGGAAAGALGGIGGALAKALKVLGPVAAVLGTAYEGFSGWNDKDLHKRAFGLEDGREATTGQKASAAIGSILDLGGLTSGLGGLLGFEFDSADITRAVYGIGTKVGEWASSIGEFFSRSPLEMLQGAWEGVSSLGASLCDGVLSVANGISSAFFGGDVSTLWEGAKATVLNGIQSLATSVLGFFTDEPAKVLEGVKAELASSYETVKAAASGLVNNVLGFFGADTFGDLFSTAPAQILGAATETVHAVATALGGPELDGKISQWGESIATATDGFFSSVKDTIGGWIDKGKSLLGLGDDDEKEDSTPTKTATAAPAAQAEAEKPASTEAKTVTASSAARAEAEKPAPAEAKAAKIEQTPSASQPVLAAPAAALQEEQEKAKDAQERAEAKAALDETAKGNAIFATSKDILESIAGNVGSILKHLGGDSSGGQSTTVNQTFEMGGGAGSAASTSSAFVNGGQARDISGRRTFARMADDFGGLAAQHESGGNSARTVDNHEGAGTSFGRFQIAGRATRQEFLRLMEANGGGDIAAQLRAAGFETATGNGGAAGELWKRLASEGKIQQYENLYRDRSWGISYGGLKNENLKRQIAGSRALQEAYLSKSFQGQYGAYADMNRLYRDGMSDEEVLDLIYDTRLGRAAKNPKVAHLMNGLSGRFGKGKGSEREKARAMLRAEKSGGAAPASAFSTPSPSASATAGPSPSFSGGGGGWNASVGAGVQRYAGRVGYSSGSHGSLQAGRIDCSGWVGEQLKSAVPSDVAKRILSAGGSFAGTAAGIIQGAYGLAGRMLTGDSLSPSRVTDGLVIGIDNFSGKNNDRYNGIDHVVMTYRDPQSGQVMVTESSSSKGVHATTYERWYRYWGKFPMYGVPLAGASSGGASQQVSAPSTPPRLPPLGTGATASASPSFSSSGGSSSSTASIPSMSGGTSGAPSVSFPAIPGSVPSIPAAHQQEFSGGEGPASTSRIEALLQQILAAILSTAGTDAKAGTRAQNVVNMVSDGLRQAVGGAQRSVDSFPEMIADFTDKAALALAQL